METEKFDEEMFRECKAKFEIKPTIPGDTQDKLCPVCKTVCICMRLDKSPKEKFMDNIFIFYGCPNCQTICYEESKLKDFARKECSLKDYLIESGHLP
jgi:hypothetical protein